MSAKGGEEHASLIKINGEFTGDTVNEFPEDSELEEESITTTTRRLENGNSSNKGRRTEKNIRTGNPRLTLLYILGGALVIVTFILLISGFIGSNYEFSSILFLHLLSLMIALYMILGSTFWIYNHSGYYQKMYQIVAISGACLYLSLLEDGASLLGIYEKQTGMKLISIMYWLSYGSAGSYPVIGFMTKYTITFIILLFLYTAFSDVADREIVEANDRLNEMESEVMRLGKKLEKRMELTKEYEFRLPMAEHNAEIIRAASLSHPTTHSHNPNIVTHSAQPQQHQYEDQSSQQYYDHNPFYTIK